MQVIFRPEQAGDRAAIFAVHRQAFPTDAEARLVDALRDGDFSRVSCVAEAAGGEIVGHVLFSDLPIRVSSNDESQRTIAALSLAPVAVLPTWQGRGIGTNLIRRGLQACREQDHRIVLVLGEPEFYGRFGFSAALAARLQSPFPAEYFQALELQPGALDGVAGAVGYPPPFGTLA